MTNGIIKRVFVVGAALVMAAASLYTPTASAHGEKSQQAFLRMRTIHWYNLKWSTDKLQVNEEMTVSGNFHVWKDWPQAVREPENSFLNVGSPGPVVVRTESYINGHLVPRSVRLIPGGDYEFKFVLKGRRPGTWHIHTMINVSAGGPMIGPGKWVTIEGSMASFTNPIKTLTGQTIDIETWGISNVYGWSLLWYLFGIAWVVYWARNPLFIPRHLKVQAGQDLITDADRKASWGFLAAAIVLTVYSYSSGQSAYPITIPLQAGTLRGIEPLQIDRKVDVVVKHASYRVPGRQVSATLEVTNKGDSPVELTEFETGGIRFLNAAVFKDDTGYPADMLAENGLTVEGGAVGPGETKTIQIQAEDAAWEVQRMADVVYDPDSRFGALLHFFDAQGKHHIAPIGGPLIPQFM